MPSTYTERWQMYLRALKEPFVKLSRIEFLQPDGSVAFALDNNPKNRRSGAFIQSGDLSVNLQNGQRRTANVTLANLDGEYDFNVNNVWFGQQIRLSEGLILPDGSDFYLPQGVFYIKDPEEKLLPNTKTATYHLEDKWSYLNGTLFGNLEGIYEITRGTNIFTAIQSILSLGRGNGYPVDGEKPIFTQYYNGRTTVLPSGEIVSLLSLPYTYRNDGENGTYADIVLEMAGNSMGCNYALMAAGKGSHIVFTGNPEEVISFNRDLYWKILRNELTIHGTWNSGYAPGDNDWNEVIRYMDEGEISAGDIVTDCFKLDEYEKAFDLLMSDRFYTKIMFDI